MVKSSRLILFLILAMVAVIFVGCGGSGGGTSNPTTKGIQVISGKVVSASTGAGVGNVIITLGNTSLNAITKADGSFKFSISSTTSLPTYIQVDTSGAGKNFPAGNVVKFNGQVYESDFIDVPVDVLNGVQTNMGSLSVYDVGSGNNPPPPPFASKDTIISGRVVSEKTGLGIENVTITFGQSLTVSALSGPKGYFALNLGKNTTVSTYYASPGTFAVDTTTAGTKYVSTLLIGFGGANYEQSKVSVPSAILNDTTTVMGTLTVRDTSTSDGGGDTPPPPPGGDGGGDTPPPPPM